MPTIPEISIPKTPPIYCFTTGCLSEAEAQPKVRPDNKENRKIGSFTTDLGQRFMTLEVTAIDKK